MKDSFHAPIRPLRTTWNETRLLIRGPLTDHKIEVYAKRGWYSDEYREARRELIARKNAKRQEKEGRREGNFLVFNDGRQIYSP